MASTVTQKQTRQKRKPRATRSGNATLNAAELKELMKQAVREVLDEQAEREAKEWDRQIEADAKIGRLNHLADEALSDLREGRAREL